MIGQEKLQKFKAEFGSRNCSKGGVHRDCCGSEDSKFLERLQIGDCRCSHTETADLIPSVSWKNSSVSKRDEMSLDSWKCFNNLLQNIFKFANVIILPPSCELSLVTSLFLCVLWCGDGACIYFRQEFCSCYFKLSHNKSNWFESSTSC